MSNSNPGPASSGTSLGQTLSTQQGRRLLAVGKAVSVGAAGDIAIPMLAVPTNFVVTDVWTVNSNSNISSATLGLYTAVSQGGTAIVTTAALTSQTSSAYAKSLSVAAATTNIGGQANLYVNIGTAVAGGTTDVYVYGYDFS